MRQLAAGANMAWVLEAFPSLCEEDVFVALRFAADRSVAPAVAAE